MAAVAGRGDNAEEINSMKTVTPDEAAAFLCRRSIRRRSRRLVRRIAWYPAGFMTLWVILNIPSRYIPGLLHAPWAVVSWAAAAISLASVLYLPLYFWCRPSAREWRAVMTLVGHDDMRALGPLCELALWSSQSDQRRDDIGRRVSGSIYHFAANVTPRHTTLLDPIHRACLHELAARNWDGAADPLLYALEQIGDADSARLAAALAAGKRSGRKYGIQYEAARRLPAIRATAGLPPDDLLQPSRPPAGSELLRAESPAQPEELVRAV